jgi:hypothetical protein
MNVRSTFIASALIATLVAAGCGTDTDTSSPSALSGYVAQQSNYEESLLLAAREAAAKAHHSVSGATQARPHCRMASDAVEQWLTNGVVPRCQLLTTPRHSHKGVRRTR